MKKKLMTLAGAALWLLVWQIGAMLLDSRILLVSPIDVVIRLAELIPSAEFIKSVLFSMGRILAGFALGVTAGTALAFLAGKIRAVRQLLSPLVSVVKAIPVASFTILALIWVSSRNLSVLVAFLICFPIVYSNMLEGIDSLDPKLVEMADVFDIPAGRRFVGIYLSQLLPYFRSASCLAVGLCWKSGAAAEVIGVPDGSIGEKLFMAKVYLETADLFAWTLVVILLSWCCEKLFGLLISLAVKRVERMTWGGGSKDTSQSAAAEVTASGVSKAYGKNAVIEGFTHTFAAGSTAAVVGASGRGKTTLLGLLMGTIPPDSGSISRPERISAVFQEDRLCENLTVCANIRLAAGNRVPLSDITEALNAVGLAGCENKPVRELSGGMKRRTALLRALLSDHGALFLDEPFKGLDEETKSAVVAYCKDKTSSGTVIFVTHDKAECDFLADEVINIG